MFSNTEFNHLKLKLDQLYLSLSGGKVNGETVFSKKVTFGSGKKTIKIHDGIIEGLDFPEGHLLGTCTTAAATAAKVVTLADATGWELKQGATICIKFTNTNTAQNPTLNVNNSGAKSVYYNTGLITTGSLWTAGEANRFTSFMYDGTNWVWIGSSVDRNTTYSAMSTSELTTGTATTSRVVRADYLKKGIEEIIKAPITDIVNVYGAKNLLPLSLQNIKALNTSGTWNDNSYTVSGVTYTVNVDTNGNITNIDVTGTASTNATLMLYGYSYSNTSTNIIFDNPIIASDNFNGSSTTARCIVWGTSSGYVDDEELYIPASTFYGCGIRIISGYVIPSNGITFYPMLRLASIQDDTYVPYAKTNKELTDTFTNQIADSDDTYSPSKAYKVGEHCIYNNVIYKCITACSAAAWSVNQNCFEETTLTTAVTELNSDLTLSTANTTYFHLFKFNGCVFGTWRIVSPISIPSGGWLTLPDSIPSGYKPKSTIHVPFTSETASGFLQFEIDGTVKLYCTSSNVGSYIACTLVWNL